MRPNQLVFCFSGVWGSMLALFRGRSVRPLRYSMMYSMSSFSLRGLEAGMPSLTGADSPLKRSPNSLLEEFCCAVCGRCSGEGDGLGALGLSFGTNAARDLARECRTVFDLERAAAVGCAFCMDDSRRDPMAGLSGVYALSGVERLLPVYSMQSESLSRPWAPSYPVEMFERLSLLDEKSETSRTLDLSGVAIGDCVEKASPGPDMLPIDMASRLKLGKGWSEGWKSQKGLAADRVDVLERFPLYLLEIRSVVKVRHSCETPPAGGKD